jgi:hypothetical protein
MKMDTPLIAALAAVLGSIVGGSASIATAWITQKTQSKREVALGEVRKRETLYTEFIVECTRLLIDSFKHNLERPEGMMTAYALKNRMQLTSSDAVINAADKILKRIIDQYFAKNITDDELRDIVEYKGSDPLREFSEACRKEMRIFLL